MHLGYACINQTLAACKPKIYAGRTCRKATFIDKGLAHVGELALANARDLLEILKWNVANDIYCFRVSGDIIPWQTEYAITDLPNYSRLSATLQACGAYAHENGIRLSTHPGPFNVLCSPHDHVVDNTIAALRAHGELFDMMGLSRSPYNKINIHCNGAYGDKISAMDRFCKNFDKLPESVRSRLTVENDDKASLYSVKDLMYIHERIGIPIVFDYHHHQFNSGGLTEQAALELALCTWPADVVPMVHYSESVNKKKPQAHSDFVQSLPKLYGYDVDIMLEAKAKEQALLEVRTTWPLATRERHSRVWGRPSSYARPFAPSRRRLRMLRAKWG